MADGKVCVGIVTYNSEGDLGACFESLRAQTYPHVHITVLDNHSSDNSVGWVRRHAPEAALIDSDVNLGFGRGHNAILQSLSLADSDFYLPLNPDARLSPDYLARLVAASREHDAGWLTGKLLLVSEEGAPTGEIYSAGQGILRSGHVINVGQQMPDDGQFDAEREVMLASGAALLLRADLIRDLSESGDLFEPLFFMYGEDIDLGWRARLRGWRCWYVPAVSAYHRGGSQSPRTRALALANLYLSAFKNAFAVDLITLIIPQMLASLMARCILSPRQGLATTAQVLRGAVHAVRKRTRAKVTRGDMLAWYRWTAEQPTGQTRSLVGRIRKYLAHRSSARRL